MFLKIIKDIKMMARSVVDEETFERQKLVNCLDSMTELFVDFKQSTHDHTSS